MYQKHRPPESRMTSDRTFFFGRIPEKSVAKKGRNRPVADRRFTAIDCVGLEVRFTASPLAEHFALGTAARRASIM